MFMPLRVNISGQGEGERRESIFDSYRSTQNTVFLRNLKVGEGLESGGGGDDGVAKGWDFHLPLPGA